MKFSTAFLFVAAAIISFGASAQTAPTSGPRGVAPYPRPAIKPAPGPRIMRTPQQMMQIQIDRGTLPSGFVIPQGANVSLPAGYRVP